MRYFTYLAEQAFKTSATGGRLFYRGGPWSRPFIIPDADTERRLYKKQVWMLRSMLGGLILGQPFLFAFLPEVIRKPYWFFSYLVIVVVGFWLAGRIAFASDLRSLQRAPVRLGPRSFYSQMAGRHSKTALFLGLIASLLFVAGGIWRLNQDENPAIAILCVGFFGLCAVAWSYALLLKLKTEGSPNSLDGKV